jgi:hypothetical protein
MCEIRPANTKKHEIRKEASRDAAEHAPALLVHASADNGIIGDMTVALLRKTDFTDMKRGLEQCLPQRHSLTSSSRLKVVRRRAGRGELTAAASDAGDGSGARSTGGEVSDNCGFEGGGLSAMWRWW